MFSETSGLSQFSLVGSPNRCRGLVPAIAGFVLLGRLRRPKAPQTSFYQPVRIKVANVAVADVASGAGRVVFMKLAFTNPHYLDLFRNSNREAIEAGAIAAVKA